MNQRSLVVVSAGLRSPSSTRLLADQLADAAHLALRSIDPSATWRVHHVEVRQHAHTIADALLTGFPTNGLAEDLDRVRDADALVLVTPTFQGTFSGLFKSFLDLLQADDVRGLPVLLAATGGSERHSLVIEHGLRPVVAYLGMLAVPTGVYAATSDFGPGAAALAARGERAAAELARLVSPATPASPVARTDEAVFGFTPFDELLAGMGQR